MKRFWLALRTISLIIFTIFIIETPAWSWWTGGHGILTQAAVKALPEEPPEEPPKFFRSGGGMIAHCAFDPDVSKNRGAPNVRGTEQPEHYIDLELLKGRPLPKSRYEFIRLCAEMDMAPEKVGLLPYAIAEWTERLAVAFAEHRKWPDNHFIQNKCLVYAGILAHYAQDMCQPLHLTIHFDGRAKADGSSPRSGIHDKVDALIEYLEFDPNDLARGQKIEPLSDLMAGILKQLEKGHALVDRLYELEARLPSLSGGEGTSFSGPKVKPDQKLVDFAAERAREATRYTAALFLTAWKISGQVQIPEWLDRAKVDQKTSSSR